MITQVQEFNGKKKLNYQDKSKLSEDMVKKMIGLQLFHLKRKGHDCENLICQDF